MQQLGLGKIRRYVPPLAIALAFGLLAAPSSGAAEKTAVFDMDRILAHMIPSTSTDETRFRGPEGDAIRTEIKVLYEGIDDLDDEAFAAREQKIVAKRRDLFALKVEPPKSKPAQKLILETVEGYAKEKGFDIAYSVSFLSSLKYAVVVTAEKTDITQAVIARLIESGQAVADSGKVRRHVEGLLKQGKKGSLDSPDSIIGK